MVFAPTYPNGNAILPLKVLVLGLEQAKDHIETQVEVASRYASKAIQRQLIAEMRTKHIMARRDQ